MCAYMHWRSEDNLVFITWSLIGLVLTIQARLATELQGCAVSDSLVLGIQVDHIHKSYLQFLKDGFWR